jgi:redox-sensitive bicupin YhaK (pirin superfamily)
MSAGSGLRHSEFNRGNVPLKLFQIWLAPNRLGARPSYATRRFPDRERSNGLTILASGLAEDVASGALPLRADARLLAGRLKRGHSMRYLLEGTRDVYVVPAAGTVSLNGAQMGTGDGAAIAREATLEFEALEDAELVAVEVL